VEAGVNRQDLAMGEDRVGDRLFGDHAVDSEESKQAKASD
jgi:hypothetical protein